MAEWLTHVFVAYGMFTVAGWYIEWLDGPWIAVGVVGSVLPDLSRLHLLISGDSVSALFGVPFGWGGLHTLGGTLFLAGIGALLFDRRRDQLRAFGLLFAGGLSHLLIDVPQRYADGQTLTNFYLFPFGSRRVPTPGWYVSADRWVAVVALLFAVFVFLLDRYLVEA